MLGMLAAVDHEPSRRAVELERAFLAELGAGCSLPVGAHASNRVLTAFLASDDGSRHLIETIDLPDDHTVAIARGVALARSMHDRLQ
jgi:hydroxymethylbilane synthase